MIKTNDKSPIPKHHSRYGFPDETKPTKPVTRKIPSRLRLILLILALAASHGKVPESNPRSVERPSRSYWCLVGNGWESRLLGWLLLVISSDYGSFPHSLPPVRRLAIGFHWNSKARSDAHRCREVWYEFFWLINLSRVFPPSHPNTISEADLVSEVQVPSKQLILKPNN